MADQKIVIRLLVSSERLGVVELENAIGLKADQQWEKGALRGKTTIRERSSGWIRTNEFPLDVTLEEGVVAMLRRVASVGEKLRALDSNVQKEISVVIYCSRPPTMFLSSATTKVLGAYGLGIDFDLYILRH